MANYGLTPWQALNANPFEAFENEIRNFFGDATTRRERTDFKPLMEVREDDEKFELSFDLPGLTKEDVQIEIHQGVLTISGERKTEKKENTYTERKYGSFRRSLTLPKGTDQNDVNARFEHGVLSVTVPKKGDVGRKTVTID